MELIQDYPRSQVYYQPRPVGDETTIKEAIMAIAGKYPTYGYRRMAGMLQREGHEVNHKRVIRLMREMGIVGQRPVKRKRTTNSNYGFQ